MIVNGIEVSEQEVQTALSQAGDSLIDVPDGKGGVMPLTVICRAALPEAGRIKNVQHNIKRKTLRFMDLPFLYLLRQDPIAIVGGGPSVQSDLDEIRKFKYVMAAGSSHDFLMQNGITPTFAVATDPKDETAEFYKFPNLTTCYIIASQCTPALFDRLQDHNVAMWHFRDQVDEEHYQGEPSICWGCMVGVNCIQLALYLGFQEQHYFGYDCSVGDETHAYPVSSSERQEIMDAVTVAEIGDEKTKFKTTTSLICQATHFFGVYRCPDGQYLKGYVYGTGMLREIIRQSPPEMSRWLQAA